MRAPYFGVSAYLANAWNKETRANYFRCFPPRLKKLATTVLWGSVGQPVNFLEEFIDYAGNRPHLVQIHASAETARRTGRDGKQICKNMDTATYNKMLESKNAKVVKGVENRIQTIISKVGPLTKPNTTMLISVGLEDNLSQKAALNLMEIVLESLPKGWLMSRNPMEREYKQLPRELIEGHGRMYHLAQDIWNFDGVHVGAIDDKNIEDIGYENCLGAIKNAVKMYRVVYLWSALAQGWKNVAAQPYTGRTYLISEAEQSGFRYILKEASK